MSAKPSDLVQGTLDMLILKTLALEPVHGYGTAVRIEQMGVQNRKISHRGRIRFA
jgi:PadR family transcriptional regulator, regulatory protein PadR